MALSKLQKGLIGLGIAVVAVIAVGYGGMRYLENAVVDAIRTWAAQTPQDARVELGDVSYTLMLIGGIKVYGKFSSGDPDTSKTAASWFGACIFLIVSATILRSFFL